ncbi:hypothetical protein [Tamlana crocina]|uniref:Riboflavin synthase subunit beta n=1 Tax=Tamlana crocina TaxID=393006 RepID=A0ABX1DEJ2_9FLAO|nr:hypothetical protein [Tamlana crocina]NJX16755.1 hypothetical protein [Tamlana crocina]
MARNKRRHSTGFGYIGFGNNQSVFNQSANKSFSALKERLNQETHYHYELHFTHKKLTKTEKEAIKNKIRTSEKLRFRKTIIAFVLMAIPVAFLIGFLIKKLSSNL